MMPWYYVMISLRETELWSVGQTCKNIRNWIGFTFVLLFAGAFNDIKIEHDIENIDPQPKSDEENKRKRDQINGCIMAHISTSPPLSHKLGSCNQYGNHLMKNGVFITDAEKGSVIITVECETMEALNELWEDYKSGRLNRMAEKCLITEDLKSSCGCQEIKLKTRIEEETYIKYRETLIRKGEAIFLVSIFSVSLC